MRSLGASDGFYQLWRDVTVTLKVLAGRSRNKMFRTDARSLKAHVVKVVSGRNNTTLFNEHMAVCQNSRTHDAVTAIVNAASPDPARRAVTTSLFNPSWVKETVIVSVDEIVRFSAYKTTFFVALRREVRSLSATTLAVATRIRHWLASSVEVGLLGPLRANAVAPFYVEVAR